MERETLNFSTSPAEIASSLKRPKKGMQGPGTHIVTNVSVWMLPMLGFWPREGTLHARIFQRAVLLSAP